MELPTGLEAFQQYNHTELYQLCLRAGLAISPHNTREELASYLIGELEGSTENVIDSWRHGLAGFVLEHWSVLQNQITCPLSSKDPRSCFGCLDTQVVACLTDNAKHLTQIRRHRK